MVRIIADLHIHSRYSRATSPKMGIEEINRFAKVKGLRLVGTGDSTHPKWLRELKDGLVEQSHVSLYKLASDTKSLVHFMITNEVCTIFTFEENVKKIHHVILTPTLEVAIQVNDRLARYGDLTVDGRPTLDMTAPQLVEEVMSVSKKNVVIPSHVWTPWFGLFGAFSGFDRVEDCYQDTTKYISALETGLSSNPPMNWRLSALDKYVLVSNSDSHSAYPWRIGREANVFELEKLTYNDVVDAIRKKDSSRLRFTIETNPEYGKYHWTGHRNCNISFSPKEAVKSGNRCPVCHKHLTKGVEQRVEELADRPVGFKPETKTGFINLIPLSEIIASVLEVKTLGSQKVWTVYNSLISRFGNEYTVLLKSSMKEMAKIVNPNIVEAIIRVRNGKARVTPGYDGVYGQLKIFGKKLESSSIGETKQGKLADFI